MALSDTLTRLRERLTGKTTGAARTPAVDEPSEGDVASDSRLVSSRPTGGEHEQHTGDAGSVTGTGRTDEFVGQVAGDDLGYAGESGAEARRTGSPERE